MKNAILNFPHTLDQGFKLALLHSGKKSYKKLVICGMGGSGIPGTILSLTEDNVVVWQNYGLPEDISTGDLVVCTSWSGDTQETISSFDKAREMGLETYVITKGGILADKAKTENAVVISMPDEPIPARLGAGYMLGALLALLGIKLDALSLASNMETEAASLAGMIGRKNPVVYSPYKLRHIAGLWRILFNENAKLPALSNYFPAAAHNEIEVFNSSNKDKLFPILIKDGPDRDINAAIAFFSQIGYDCYIVNLSGPGESPREAGIASESLLSKTLNSYIFGLWTSYLLAQNLGVDSKKTELIDTFKRLKKN
ncbi:MAG: SIS domain-containing protein [Candidatus Yanofskybacteria bacterium]|nr:SIS domain-containing protein [Candidatus Yanofskybacteria bacterium]